MSQTNTTSTLKSSTVFSFKTPKIPGLPAIDSGTHLIADPSVTKPNELVAGLLHQGTKGVLASSSKAGKTWILLALALSVATGTKFLQWHTIMGKVLFINFEIQKAFIKERLSALMKSRGIQKCDGLDFWNLRGKTADFEALVANIIKEVEGKNYALIILDPIYKAMVGRSENGSSGVGVLCNQLERLAERSGAAVVYSHHFPKGNQKKKAAIDRLSGSGVFARDADSIITLTEHTEADCFTVETILRNLAQQPAFVVQWKFPLMTEREDLDPEDVTPDDIDDGDDHGLFEIIKAKPRTTQQWLSEAIALGVSRATFYRIKAKLKEMGYIIFDFKTKLWCSTKLTQAKSDETSETKEIGGTEFKLLSWPTAEAVGVTK